MNTVSMVIFKGCKFCRFCCKLVKHEILILEKEAVALGNTVFNLVTSKNETTKILTDLPSVKYKTLEITACIVYVMTRTYVL